MTYKVYFQQLILRPETYLIKIVKEAYIEVTEIASKYMLYFNHIYGYNSISQTYLPDIFQELTINGIAYKFQDFSDDESKLNLKKKLNSKKNYVIKKKFKKKISNTLIPRF